MAFGIATCYQLKLQVDLGVYQKCILQKIGQNTIWLPLAVFLSLGSPVVKLATDVRIIGLTQLNTISIYQQSTN